MTAHLTTSQRALARRLRAKGMSLRDIAKEVGCSQSGSDVMPCGQSREAKPDFLGEPETTTRSSRDESGHECIWRHLCMPVR